MKRVIMALFVATMTTACAEVGSERWCNNLEDKPKGDWTANEASDYASHCVFRSKED